MTTTDRKWTATVEVEDRYGRTTAIDATTSRYDLLRDQTVAAVRDAVAFVDDNDVRRVWVVLYKRTDARGVERDRFVSVWRDARGVVRYQ